jgi:uncharacterized sulfatase
MPRSHLLSVFGLAVLSGLRAAAATDQPNILIVINDDQSWLECSAYGNSSIPTPHFDRVARSGVLFTHGYTSAPSCAPARAALLTGRNFWELEQGAFIQAWLPVKFATVPEVLEPAGYHAGYTGKGWGPGVKEPTGRRADPAGKPWNGIKLKAPPPGINPIDYAANFAKFLEERPAGKPFYFWAGLTEPHHPHGKNNHQKLGLGPDAVKVPGFLPDTPGVRRHRANYLYEVRYADEVLGKLLKLLEQRGELDNTLVIATADNGTPVPRAKTNVYDWGVRVPLAMMWPARVPAGRTVGDFVNFADLAPTILEAAGLPVPPDMSGRSALGVLTSRSSGRVDPTRDFTVAGLEWHGDLPPCGLAARMIRDEQFQYVVNYSAAPRLQFSKDAQPDDDFKNSAESLDVTALLSAHRNHPEIKRFVALIQAPRPREELYDCAADPDQLRNLAEAPEFAGVKQQLRAKLEAYQRATRDPRVTGDMAVFEETLKFVQQRKSTGYGDKTGPRPEAGSRVHGNPIEQHNP